MSDQETKARGVQMDFFEDEPTQWMLLIHYGKQRSHDLLTLLDPIFQTATLGNILT